VDLDLLFCAVLGHAIGECRIHVRETLIADVLVFARQVEGLVAVARRCVTQPSGGSGATIELLGMGPQIARLPEGG